MKRHLIGIGGVGMSALATALVRLGDEVTGADRTLGTPNIRFLESLGVKCFPDDGSGVDETTDEVIVSTAIEDDNPGLKKARELGIPVTHRAKALSRTLSPYKLVAVVGTCGKSTVTAMLGHILAECGLDPMCVNGANVPGWEGAVRFGRGEYAVAEVDESDKSLVAFKPYAAVVTNASADHYSKEEMDEVFDAFVAGMPGPLVEGRRVYGEADVSVPGRHNRNNAFLALEMAKALGCDESGEAVNEIPIYKTFSYSEEYDTFSKTDRDGEALMASLATEGGGVSVSDPADVFSNLTKTLSKKYDPRMILIIVTIVLVLLDIAVRKFKFKWLHEIIRERREEKE